MHWYQVHTGMTSGARLKQGMLEQLWTSRARGLGASKVEFLEATQCKCLQVGPTCSWKGSINPITSISIDTRLGM